MSSLGAKEIFLTLKPVLVIKICLGPGPLVLYLISRSFTDYIKQIKKMIRQILGSLNEYVIV